MSRWKAYDSIYSEIVSGGAVKRPWYKWLPGDVMSSLDYQNMKLEERGIYRELLDWSWLNSENPAHLPNDIDFLHGLFKKEISRKKFGIFWEKFGKKFEKTEDGKFIFHPKILEQYRELEALSASNSEKGRKGGRGNKALEKPQLSSGLTPVKPSESDPDPDPDPDQSSPISPSLKIGENGKLGEVVEAVFNKYPRVRKKDGKIFPVRVLDNARESITAFVLARPDYPLLEAVTLLRESADMPPDLTNFLASPWDVHGLREAAAAKGKPAGPKTEEGAVSGLEAFFRENEKEWSQLSDAEIEARIQESERRHGGAFPPILRQLKEA